MTTSPWAAFPESMAPVASLTGPFPQRSFLEVVEGSGADTPQDLHLVATDHGAAAFSVDEDRFRFAGETDLTDYHTPLGPDALEVTVRALEGLGDMRFRLDSMPEEASRLVSKALNEVGAEFTVEQHEVAAVLTLPGTFEEWLLSIGKKERHEVRRKRRKFIAAFGDIEVVEGGTESFTTFASMHRTSAGAKGSFMTEQMETYFLDLLARADAKIHSLVCHGRTLATAFGFEHGDGSTSTTVRTTLMQRWLHLASCCWQQ
jgi:CelD/BcsL family acetyltransferase involved in cellulose biosynthesis